MQEVCRQGRVRCVIAMSLERGVKKNNGDVADPRARQKDK